MKTVKDYLDFGLVFVDDDMIQAVTGEPSYGSTSLARCLFKCGEYPSGIKLVGSMCGMGEWIPSSFAWRNNYGVKPAFLGTIEIEWSDGSNSIQKSPYSSYWAIPSAECSIEIVKWRPVVLQSESPTVSPSEDKPMKPVYTAEMHAKGELPPVGADCILVIDSEPRQARVAYIGESIGVCSNIDGGAEYAFILGQALFKPIIKTINVNGFDVPAPMSESPECGQKFFISAPHLGSLSTYNFWTGDRDDLRFFNRGLAHATESAAIAHAKAMLGIDPNV